MRSPAFYSIIQLALSFIGLFVAGTLYYAHRANISLPCSSGSGCDLVAASHWAYIAGIPVSLLGTVGYLLLALLSVVKMNAESPAVSSRVRWLMFAIALGGVCYSWYLQYVASVFIGAFCIWCRTSAITMSLLFASLLVETIYISRGNSARGNVAGTMEAKTG